MGQETLKAHWKNIRPYFHHHHSFYDHPLNGVAVLNGEWWWFEWPYQSERITLRRMGRREAWANWARWMRFGVMVGWHTTYKNGERPRFGCRRPRWFFNRLATAYYHGFWRGFTSPIFGRAKRQSR